MENKNATTIMILAAAALLVVGGFVALKNHKDRVAPTPAPVTVVEAPVEEPAPAEKPARTVKKRAKRDTATAISFENATSVSQNSQPEEYATTSEVVDYAYEMLEIGRAHV